MQTKMVTVEKMPILVGDAPNSVIYRLVNSDVIDPGIPQKRLVVQRNFVSPLREEKESLIPTSVFQEGHNIFLNVDTIFIFTPTTNLKITLYKLVLKKYLLQWVWVWA